MSQCRRTETSSNYDWNKLTPKWHSRKLGATRHRLGWLGHLQEKRLIIRLIALNELTVGKAFIEFPHGVREIEDVADDPNFTIKLYNVSYTDPVQPACSREHTNIKVDVQEYTPLPGEPTKREWGSGSRRTQLALPNVAIPKSQLPLVARKIRNIDCYTYRPYEELKYRQDEFVYTMLEEAISIVATYNDEKRSGPSSEDEEVRFGLSILPYIDWLTDRIRMTPGISTPSKPCS